MPKLLINLERWRSPPATSRRSAGSKANQTGCPIRFALRQMLIRSDTERGMDGIDGKGREDLRVSRHRFSSPRRDFALASTVQSPRRNPVGVKRIHGAERSEDGENRIALWMRRPNFEMRKTPTNAPLPVNDRREYQDGNGGLPGRAPSETASVGALG